MNNEHALRSDIDAVADTLIAHMRDCDDDDCTLCALDSSSDDDPPPAAPDLAGRYRAMHHDPDPARRALARAQLQQIRRAQGGGVDGDDLAREDRVDLAPAVLAGGALDLAGLITATAGPLTARGPDRLVGACPWHASKSGACLVIWPADGRWWCSSCKRGGGAVAWLALVEGIEHGEARRRLRLPRQRA